MPKRLIVNKYKADLKKLMEKHHVAEWVQGEYRFLFEKEDYFWKGERIRVTDCEALYLYERLVLGLSQSSITSSNMLYQLRYKHGKTFLAEVIPYDKGKAHRVPDVVWEAEGGLVEQVKTKLRKRRKI
jgi:hypothetical protein